MLWSEAGQTSIFGGVLFVSKSLLGIEVQIKKKLEILTHVGAMLEY